jgi:CheY-like chemotaxis protein
MSFLDGLLSRLGRRAASARTPLRVLLLDDDERRHDWFAERFDGDQLDIAVEPAAAIELLAANAYDAIFLDHDLLPEHYRTTNSRDEERTGYAVAAWLAAHPDRQRDATIVIHSLNYTGAGRMLDALQNAGRDVEHIPFHYLELEL